MMRVVQRGSGRGAMLAALLLCLFLPSQTAFSEAAEASYDLTDDRIEFLEVPELVSEYSILGRMEKQTISDSMMPVQNVEQELKRARQEIRDGLSDSIEDLRALCTETDSPELRAALAGQIGALEQAKDGRGESLAAPMVKQLTESLKDTRRSEQNAVRAIQAGFYNGKKQFGNAMQGLFYTYKGMELTERLLRQQCELYRQSYEKAVKQQALGTATALSVTEAEGKLREAENNLGKLQDGMDKLLRTLGTSLGWTTLSYRNICLGELPDYPLNYLEGRSLETDTASALQQNAEYGTAQRIKDADFTKWDQREISIAHVSEQVRLEMQSLWDAVGQKAAAETAAETSAELARRKKERAERMENLGLLGNAEYSGLQLDYISKENAALQARLDYGQAVFRYEQAVHKGMLTLE